MGRPVRNKGRISLMVVAMGIAMALFARPITITLGQVHPAAICAIVELWVPGVCGEGAALLLSEGATPTPVPDEPNHPGGSGGSIGGGISVNPLLCGEGAALLLSEGATPTPTPVPDEPNHPGGSGGSIGGGI